MILKLERRGFPPSDKAPYVAWPHRSGLGWNWAANDGLVPQRDECLASSARLLELFEIVRCQKRRQ